MYGTRAKIGLIIPSNNTVIEPELAAMCPPGVTVHGNRILTHGNTPEGIVEMEKGAARAVAEFARAQMSVIAYACLATSLVKGADWTRAVADRIAVETGGKATTAAVATVEPDGCPALQAPAGKTTYHLVVSPEGLGRPDRSATREEAASADRNTILVIESPEGRAMPWMGGGDDGVEVLMGSDEGCHAGGVMALFADGSVHFLHIDSLPLDVRRSLITPEALARMSRAVREPASTISSNARANR